MILILIHTINLVLAVSVLDDIDSHSPLSLGAGWLDARSFLIVILIVTGRCLAASLSLL